MAFSLSGLARAASRFLVVPSLLSTLTTPRLDPNNLPIPPNNQLNITHQWSQLDFNYPSNDTRDSAIESGNFIPENVIPFGIDVWEDRIFVTLPKLREGIPATLASVSRLSDSFSPMLDPYPNWDFYNDRPGCLSMISVFRVATDPCGRLWVLDSGKVNVAFNITEVCPPQLFIFDLYDDRLLRRYVFPEKQALVDNFFNNIVVDYQGDCQDVYAYMADTERYNLLVYSYKNRTSWRISHGSFYPDPMKFNYQLDDLKWYWNYGLSGLALGPMLKAHERMLYYHATTSYKEFVVPTSVLKNPAAINESNDKFVLLGERGYSRSHAGGSAISRSGVLFYALPEHHVAACWDTNNTEFSSLQQGVIGVEKRKLAFPNDVKVDHEKNQSVWILSNNLHMYLFGKINPQAANYIILRANTETAVKKTVCSPTYNMFRKRPYSNTTVNYETTSVRMEAETVEPSTSPLRSTTITVTTTTTTTTTTAATTRSTPTTATNRGASTTASTTTTPTTTTTERSRLGNLLETAGRMLEDCRDLPIGPDGLRPCDVIDRSRNTVNRMLANSPIGDVLNNGALENAVGNMTNNPISNAVNNTINLIRNNPISNAIGNIAINPIRNIANNNPFRNRFRGIFG
ncbi:dopaminechrome tautomerase-like [Anabrus simplex]|uniref:dopaminechrome tautomerase-like n=1 Tax=Anabrus simplex TaxID=316456 RepID=UPI0035A2C33F